MTRIAARLGAAMLAAAFTAAAAWAAAADRSPVPEDGWFEDVAEASGLDFVHFNGMTGKLYMVEILGAGAALFDFDNDGDLDLLVVQGAVLEPGGSPEPALFPPAPGMLPLGARLYRNDLEITPSGRRLRFTDVTEASGLKATGYGMGVATGDFDGDGFVDVYLTCFGPNQLWRNNGDGTFSDVTRRAGVDDPRWNVSASFLDYDRDGHLDLFVSGYLDFKLATATTCHAASGEADYCGPGSHPPLPDRLFRNRGDGTFEDVSRRAGITAAFGPALGVVTTDADGDGWPDIYVANDRAENQLWLNQRDGTFRDVALLAGCAVDLNGRAQSSMGVDSGDVDGDHDEDLFLTHLRGETNTLYLNRGDGSYDDASIRSGLGAPSLRHTAFGTRFFDLDNDGDLDLLTVNGAMARVPELVAAGDPFPLHETNQLYLNIGGGRFEEISRQGGAAFALSELSTGAAFGDVDNDGAVDVVVVNNNGRLRLLRNRGNPQHHWVGLSLKGGGRTGCDMIGALVETTLADGRRLVRRARTDGSYASASDPRVVLGLGVSRAPIAVVVTWPDGARERFDHLVVDRYTTLTQGSGRPLDQAPGELPRPSLAGLERQARHQVEGLWRRVEALDGRPETTAPELAAALGAVAMALHAYEAFGDAAQWYRAAGRLAPEDWRWPYLSGHALLGAADLGGARDAFEQASALEFLLPSVALARVLLETGELEQARDRLTRVVAAHPDLAAGHALLADVAMARGDPASAVRGYQRALDLQPGASRLHGQLALALARVSRDEEARRHLALRGRAPVMLDDEPLAAVAALNLNASTHLERCMTALAAERFQQAAAECRIALALGSSNPAARLNLGAALLAMGDPEAAAAEYRELLRLDPEDVTARFNLATTLARMGRDQVAIAHYRRALEFEPAHRDARLNLANALSRVGMDEEALEHYRAILDRRPDDSGALRGQTACLERLRGLDDG